MAGRRMARPADAMCPHRARRSRPKRDAPGLAATQPRTSGPSARLSPLQPDREFRHGVIRTEQPDDDAIPSERQAIRWAAEQEGPALAQLGVALPALGQHTPLRCGY